MHLGIHGGDPPNVKISILIYPEFTEFLVRAGIDSVSINPDATVFTRNLLHPLSKE
jgi:phosphoenolpyruvate synthase/pyruvate phosphate dikinase